MRKPIILLIAVLLPACCCKTTKDGTKEKPDSLKTLSPTSLVTDSLGTKATLADIAAAPDAFVGKTVVLEGTFQGYSGVECFYNEKFSAQVTRSDWVFRSDSLCMYVTGGIPTGYNPMDAKDKGRKIVLSCLVKLTSKEKLILVYKQTIK